MGEPLDAAPRAHLAACADCAREVASLAAAAAVARAGDGGGLVAPPAAVWDRVHHELGLADDVAPEDAGTRAVRDDAAWDDAAQDGAVRDDVVRGDAADGGATAGGPERAGADPAPARRRRRRPWLAAAAAGLVVGGVAGGLAVSAALRPEAETVVAEVRLEALPGWSASGDAQVEEDAEGRRTLVVRVTDADADGFREVWLLDAGATRLVSLGVLDGDEGRFALPPGLDLAEFPVVDVSAEAFDGDPAHSGDSIVRGELSLPA
nr:anti-sigma factor [Cellulomonas sp. IC4_254]